MSGEWELLKWLEQQPVPRGERSGDASISIGIGDDMAAIRLSSGATVLLGTDMIVGGVHFDPAVHTLEQIGRKAANACLSDCAAMAVRPIAMLVSIAIPKDAPMLESGQRILQSMMTAAGRWNCPVIGGDTVGTGGPMTIDVVCAAVPWPGIEPVRRSGALPGDLICVTGLLGGSILGKHLEFVPRIAEAHELAEVLGKRLHAMIDVSDGVALDLYRVCQASRCGAWLDEKLLGEAASQDAKKLSQQDGRSVVDHVLGDGEDYELLLTVGPDAKSSLESLKQEIRVIGECTSSGYRRRCEDGRFVDMQPTGWLH